MFTSATAGLSAPDGGETRRRGPCYNEVSDKSWQIGSNYALCIVFHICRAKLMTCDKRFKTGRAPDSAYVLFQTAKQCPEIFSQCTLLTSALKKV